MSQTGDKALWALVTGAGSGLGLAIAKSLADKGYHLVLVGRRLEKLQAAAHEIQTKGREVVCCPMDLARPQAAEELFEWCRERSYHFDFLVNNAGMYFYENALELDLGQIDSILQLHILTLTKICRLFGEDMMNDAKERFSDDRNVFPVRHILNISSYSVYLPMAGLSLYASSKTYIKSFSIILDKECRGSGLKVTVATPAGIDTELMRLRPMVRRLGRTLGALQPAELVAKRILKKTFRGRRCCIPGLFPFLTLPLLPVLHPVFRWSMRKDS